MKVNLFAIMMVTVFDVSSDGMVVVTAIVMDINVWACGYSGTYWESSKGLLLVTFGLWCLWESR